MDEKIMLCVHYGFNQTCKVLVPNESYVLAISVDDPELETKIIDKIVEYNINTLELVGMPIVTERIGDSVTNALPNITIRYNAVEEK